MKKLIVAAAFALSLVGGVASAQSYSSGPCLNLSQNLSVGSNGGQVLSLQQFLVSQNYPGGGSWMETGHFGQATAAAVRDFQEAQGLPQTGVVDSVTLSSLNSVSCGGSAVVTPTYPYTNPPYTYPYNSYNTGAPVITSLSQNTGVPGNSVTIYGTGFDPVNNTVYLGSTALSGIASNGGTSLSFTVPYISAGSGTILNLYVTDSRGTSNSLSFTINSSLIVCNGLTYTGSYDPCGGCSTGPFPYNVSNTCGGCGTNYFPGSPISCGGAATISYITPQSGGPGTSVTVFGSGFSTSGNTVHFGPGIITGLGSADGRSVSFIVPSQITGFGTQPLTLSTYNVSVTNANGASSNAVPFTVTSTMANNNAPTFGNIAGPSSIAAGVQGLWTITLNNPGNATSYTSVSVNWGDQNYYGAAASPAQTVSYGTQTLSFTHTYLLSGTYVVTFTASNAAGLSNTTTETVIVTGNNGNGVVTLNSVSPIAGYVGTQVVLSGTGFTGDNTVHFASGGTQHIASQNGSTLYFTIPAYASPCDVSVSGSVCAQYIQQVTPGSYPIYVTNANGTSQTVNFQVQ